MDTVGRIGTILTVSINLINWDLINQIIVLMISILTLTYWIIKIYQTTQKKKKRRIK